MRSALFLVFAVMGCGGTDPGIAPPPPPPPNLPGFHVEPGGVTPLVADDTLRFRAISDAGVDVPVHWRTETGAGYISATGRFHACGSPGMEMQVRALLQSDTTRVATSRVYVGRSGAGSASIESIRTVPGGANARWDSLSGVVALAIPVSKGSLACVPITLAQVELVTPSGVVPVGVAVYTAPSEFGFVQVFEWDTRTSSNGDYPFRVSLTRQGSTAPFAIMTGQLGIRNP